LENLGQENADLPLLLICDVLAGHLAICDKPDVSEDVLREFVEEYKSGKCQQVIPIPNNKKVQVKPPYKIHSKLDTKGHPQFRDKFSYIKDDFFYHKGISLIV